MKAFKKISEPFLEQWTKEEIIQEQKEEIRIPCGSRMTDLSAALIKYSL